jgi:peptidoglycan/xylan/chitin deacetylase (PgdA/CDA1 family)
MKALLRDAAARALFALGATAPRRAARGRLLVATFHRVLPEELRAAHPLPGLAVTPEELGRFLAFFSGHFECTTLREAASSFEAEASLARPPLALTFDDGQRDNLDHALPVLERFGARATFFAVPGCVERGEALWHERLAFAALRALEGGGAGRELLRALGGDDLSGKPARAAAGELVRRAKREAPARRAEWVERAEAAAGGSAVPEWDGLMSFEELRALAARGHEVGSHGLRHALLPQCSDAELEEEVAGSRRLLEVRLGAPVESFCYPNGDRDARVRAAVARAGYRLAVGTRWGANPRGAERLDLARLEMHAEHARARDGSFSEPRLAWRMTGFYPGLS